MSVRPLVNPSRRSILQAASLFAAVSVFGGRVPAAVETAGIREHVGWLNEVQTPPETAAAQPAGSSALADLLRDDRGRVIASRAAWESRRAQLLSEWREFLGLDGLPRPKQLPLEVLETDRDADVLRKRIRYEVEPGWVTEAYWIEPLRMERPCPAAVVFHSTVEHSILQPAGLADDVEQAFGLKLAQKGFVTLSPRNYLWPKNHGISAEQEAQRFLASHPQAKGMAKMLADALLAVDLLLQSPHVDRARIAAVGHSLGAKEVLYLAAFDPRISTTVSSEGGIGTRFSNWNAPWYLGDSILKDDFRREHHELLATIAPRPFLLIGGDSADGDRSWPYIDRAMPVYRLYQDQAAIGLYNHRKGHSIPPECESRIYEWITTYT